MNDINITIIQTKLIWENTEANICRFDDKISALDQRSDLIILPEMFTTGFTMNPQKIDRSMQDTGLKWMKQTAARHKCDIMGSMIVREKNHFYNRLVWTSADGMDHFYDKKHLFRMAGEDRIYTAGNHHLTVELNGWKIRPFICYDLRFPIWTRNLGNIYDLAIFVANWPQKRSMHWKTLLLARAIENQAYVVGVNRIGKDGNGIQYSGDSMIIDPKGEILFQASETDDIHTQTLSFKNLIDYRQDFPAWMDADNNPCKS